MIKKLLIGLLVLIVVVAAAAFVAPFLIPTATYKSRLIALVKQSTGRDLRIAGPVRLTLLPQLEVDAANVAFANAPGAAEPDMMRLKNLEVQLKLLPLLHGAVELGRFVLTDPVIALEVDRQGRPNWVMTPPGAAAATPAQPAAAPAAAAPASGGGAPLSELRLDDVRIVDGRISYRDDRTGKAELVDAVNMALSLPGLDSPFKGTGSLVWNGEKLTLAVSVAKPRALLGGQASGLAMSLAAAPLSFSFSGDATGMPPTKIGGTVDLAVPSLRGLAKWAGSPLPPGGGLGRLAIKGRIDVAGPKIAFSDAAIALDAITAKGAVALETGGAHPYLSGQLQIDKLDLNPYLPAAADGEAKPAPGAAVPGKPAPAAPAQAAGWSDAPFDLSALGSVDADFALRTGGILYRKIVIGPSALDLHLKGGKLIAALSQLTLYQGKGSGTVMLDGSGAVPALALKFNLAGLAIEPLLEAAAGTDRFSGTGKLTLDVTGRGQSQRALIAALDGTGAIDLANGAIKGVDLIGLAENPTGALGGAHGGSKTDFGALTGTFVITNGIAKNDDLQLKSGLVPITGAGTIDLPARTVNYRLNVSLAGAIGVPVLVTGPWDNLSYRPDVGGMLKGAVQQPGKALEQLKKLAPGGGGSGTAPNPGALLKGLFGK